MVEQNAKSERFFALHVKGTPLVLYNIWDAGGAKAVVETGATAVATGSWSVAAAHGFKDGQSVPLDFVEQIVQRIVASVDVPVTVDFEGAYAVAPEQVAANVARLMTAGAVGINFEDQIVGGTGLHDVADQSKRIAAIRHKADGMGCKLFINARTDLFLKSTATDHAGLMSAAKSRAEAYRAAGANGFFAPGLIDDKLIAELCEAVKLPVNIMIRDGVPTNKRMAELGVSRISYGPRPYAVLMKQLREANAAVMAGA